MLFREIARTSAIPKIVDLTAVPGYMQTGPATGGKEGTDGTNEATDKPGKSAAGRPGWTSRKKRPEVQVWEWDKGRRELERRLEGLREGVRLCAAV